MVFRRVCYASDAGGAVDLATGDERLDMEGGVGSAAGWGRYESAGLNTEPTFWSMSRPAESIIFQLGIT